MTMELVSARTREYISQNFLYTRPRFELRDELDLFRNGIIDSMGVMELIEFIQDEFKVEIADDDITEENLGTVAAIARFVSKRGEVTTA
jgi:acyl carrier protein